MLLDDPSPLVRQAMAEVFSRSSDAPAAIVQALALDQPSIALPVLEHSPLLIDADLVDIVATGNSDMQCAIARRINLPPSVSAAIAEVGSAAAALELIENAYAELAPFSWDRIVERHGHLAAIREAMLVLEGLPAATRAALVAKLTDTLAQFVVARNWLSADRAGRLANEARERSTDQHRGAFARRGHAGPGAAPARHRSIDRGPDPARAVVGQSRTVRCGAGRTGRPAAGPRHRAAARPRRRQPAGAADPRRPSRIDLRGVPRGARGQPRDRLCRYDSAARRDCAAAWSSAC